MPHPAEASIEVGFREVDLTDDISAVRGLRGHVPHGIVELRAFAPASSVVTTVIDGGGPVLDHAVVYPIFWGDDWRTSPLTAVIISALDALSGGYSSKLAQYRGIHPPRRSWSLLVSSDPGHCFSVGDVQEIVWAAMFRGVIPWPDQDAGQGLPIVFPQPTSRFSGSEDGWHSKMVISRFGGENFLVPYGFVTTASPAPDVTALVAHEVVEAITDPFGNGIQLDDEPGQKHDDSNWYEIVDRCGHLQGQLGGTNLAAYWSDEDKACVVPGLVRGKIDGTPSLLQGHFGLVGNFEAVSPLVGGGLGHMWRDNDDPTHPWFGLNPFGASLGRVDAASLVMTNAYGSAPGSLEVLARVGEKLFLLSRGPSLNQRWSDPHDLGIAGATGDVSMIQSRFGSVGNFEVVVPMADGGLGHLWRDNDKPSQPWHGPTRFGVEVGHVDGVSLIQSTYGSPGDLEVLARVGDRLVSFSRDSGPQFRWSPPIDLGVTGVTGNPSLVQGRFGKTGNYEAVVPLAAGGLGHLWRENDAPGRPWHGPTPFGQEVGLLDAVSLVQSTIGVPGDLAVLARKIDHPVFFTRDSGPDFVWSKAYIS